MVVFSPVSQTSVCVPPTSVFNSAPPSAAISVFYQNVRGLRTKLNLLRYSTFIFDYDILIFTETWLNNCFCSSELGLVNLNIFRSDRDTNTSGVIAYVVVVF